MQKVEVQLGQRSYPINIDTGFSALLASLADARQVVIVSNPTVAPLYLAKVNALFSNSPQHILIEDGEAFKTLASFEKIVSFLLKQGMSREVLLVALGGGVIGDLTGFVAASYQRGVRFLQIPTSLLSQVDSSVGGKTAVNHPLGKNMIGAFKQPEQVVISTATLTTLPEREFAAGMAEVIKYALLGDNAFLAWLLQHSEQIGQQQPDILAQMIQRCCLMKADIVSRDETEQGERALLNLGHTFGHAIEAFMGYGNWLHGEAVAVGMIMAAKLSAHRGWLSQHDVTLVSSALQCFGLPVTMPDAMHIAGFLPYMKTDKKVKHGQMRFVLLSKLGQATLVADVTERELLQVFG
ncbi:MULTISPECIES: 3-dehydroquinate synthase [unclassified Arsukibacterium]|uniref:3-dehydroquinate synthase n=1 Tax=unclassified Arsukibacterium TaxID=2635278 RepID=UPI000C6BFB7B|nr:MULTISPECIES: 3-dehydroquinate synthase [unclassified Arsukibacterium]MAA96005.1 3-dehydroquinate synthase [Rheinheimera sp.]MBM34300.1 3-dehydroquinate synthase [Rheinheimera sp.]HAW92312.1 3-dehydroquinate synthase [Candidatus Azambacteria bacterium]|tara:strand:+ start:14570 stop:15625 length:1056 start_codon:yes stop_codon:yes gene_type:complete